MWVNMESVFYKINLNKYDALHQKKKQRKFLLQQDVEANNQGPG